MTEAAAVVAAIRPFLQLSPPPLLLFLLLLHRLQLSLSLSLHRLPLVGLILIAV